MDVGAKKYCILTSIFVTAISKNATAFRLSPRPDPRARLIRTPTPIMMADREQERGGDGQTKAPWTGSSSELIDQLTSSLPSAEAVKSNVLSGNAGERGEVFVAAQFGTLFLIATGAVPFLDELFEPIGILMMLVGLAVVYKSAADLQDNLSPWPVPSDKGTLVKTGLYRFVRHPMYLGLLLGMSGLSIFTHSFERLLLTGFLFCVLDAKSTYEEMALTTAFEGEFEDYKLEVPDKLIPNYSLKIPQKLLLHLSLSKSYRRVSIIFVQIYISAHCGFPSYSSGLGEEIIGGSEADNDNLRVILTRDFLVIPACGSKS